jgi:hypothetical protein
LTCPLTRRRCDGDFLSGDQNYKLHLPKDVPVALFWSVTVYDPITGSGLDNGQPFPSLNTMDRPVQNANGSFDIYFGPKSPGEEKTDNLPSLGPKAGVFRPDVEAQRHREGAVTFEGAIDKEDEGHHR